MGAFQRVIDAALIALTHLFVCWMYDDTWRSPMTGATAAAIITFQWFAEMRGLYRAWRSERVWREAREVLETWLLVVAALVLAGFVTKTSALFSRVVTTGWFIIVPLSLSVVRLIGRTAMGRVRAQGRNTRRVAVLGMTEGAERLVAAIAERPGLGLRVIGVYDDRGEDRRHAIARADAKHIGSVDNLIRDAREGKFDFVYIALPLRAEARIGVILRELADTTVTVYMLADFFTFDLLHARWGQIGNMPVVSIYDSPFRGVNGWIKRAEDLVIGSIIVTLIAIPMLIVAIAVKVSSPGPVFFRQRRYGLNGREIRILKFRTMTVCEDGPSVQQATKNDQRVTPLGRFMRRTSLDELPQFLQVITGEMSIVGPRPHAVAHNEQYRALIHGYMLRHKVKPGITGWAQVNGYRGETDVVDKMSRRVEHDLEYIQNWNLLLDLKIIFMTVFGSMVRKNAY